MSGDYQRRMAEAERVRRELVEAAREGEYYSVGRQAADLLLREEEARQRQSIYNAGVADALARERARIQEEADEEARQYAPEVLDAAAQRLADDADYDTENVAAAAQRWREVVREEARQRESRRLTDADIAAMEPEEWARVYDVDKGQFKKGWAYVPGDGGGFGAVNAAAAGLSGSALDLKRHPG